MYAFASFLRLVFVSNEAIGTFAHLPFSKKIKSGECDKGILICGTGIGISISANKIKGIRAALCQDYYTAKYTRLHNDANVLCMGGRVIGAGTAEEIVRVFLSTEFEGGRHAARVDKMMALENK